MKDFDWPMDMAPKTDARKWVDDYGDALFRFAVARVKNQSIAEDLVQEAFLAALQSRDRFKGQSSEKTWLMAILKHKILDYYRKDQLAQALYVSPGQDDEDLDAFFDRQGQWQLQPVKWRSDPQKAHELSEFMDHFYRCLAQLPKRNADAFVYREIDGMSTEEICRLLAISTNNCWVVLYRARMLLRHCLEDVGYDPSDGRALP